MTDFDPFLNEQNRRRCNATFELMGIHVPLKQQLMYQAKREAYATTHRGDKKYD